MKRTGMWYYDSSGVSQGPVDGDEIRRLVGQGRITRSTQVWREGFQGWMRAEQTELASSFGPSAPAGYLQPPTPPPMPTSTPTSGVQAQYQCVNNLRTMTFVVHGLVAASLVFGLTSIAAVVIAYIKRDEARGTIYESHLTYAIRTFWIGLALTLGGLALSIVLVGVLVLLLAYGWFIVRAVKPLVLLLDNKPIANPKSFL